MKVSIPKGKYIREIQVNEGHLDISFKKRQKIALLFISLSPNYWPYLRQVVEDCKTNFLPHHKVDYFVWSDVPVMGTPEMVATLKHLPSQEEINSILAQGEIPKTFSKEHIAETTAQIRARKDITIFETAAIEWPHPTLMRYHLFLQQEEKLKDYDYIFYLDADMRVVDKISDEILGDGLTAAEHPMYSLRKEYIPPYEPNEKSAAYIKRPGKVLTENGAPRYKPYYIAGGFQGGKVALFIKAMKKMKENIDKDFNNNYTAIWNDESHWNKYVFDIYKGPLTVLGPEYIYPDSLINEYYIPLWGRKLVPKIITLTKPFSLSKAGGKQLTEMIGKTSIETNLECPTCHDMLSAPNHRIVRVVECTGNGKPHNVEMQKI